MGPHLIHVNTTHIYETHAHLYRNIQTHRL